MHTANVSLKLCTNKGRPCTLTSRDERSIMRTIHKLKNESKLLQTYLKLAVIIFEDFSTEEGMDIDKQEKWAFLQKMTKKTYVCK